jgi:hypothetical protein
LISPNLREVLCFIVDLSFVKELIEQTILQIYIRNLLHYIYYIDPQKEGIQKTLQFLQSDKVYANEDYGENEEEEPENKQSTLIFF